MGLDVAILIGRMLIAGMFIQAGVNGLSDIPGIAAYFGRLGLPLPLLAAWGTSLFELVAGLSLLFGFMTRPAAWLLAAFTVAAAAIGHYGQGNDPATAFLHMQAFIKDIAIAGGLLALGASGPGKLSIDAQRARRSRRA